MCNVRIIQNISGLYKYIITTDNQPVASNGGVAFFAYLSTKEPNPGTHKTFIFDVDHTNIGGHYSHHTGIFTCHSHGVYVFSSSIYCKLEVMSTQKWLSIRIQCQQNLSAHRVLATACRPLIW